MTSLELPPPPRLIAFPKSGIAYNECLYAALEARGLTVIEGVWAGRWLLSQIRARDIVHIHWPSFLYYDRRSGLAKLSGLLRFLVLYFVIRLRGGRVIWTAHNLYPHEGGRSEWVHRFVRRFISRRADLIVAHSPAAKTILRAEFGIPAGRIVEMPHGNWIGYHPHTLNRLVARSSLGISTDTYVYSMVGTCHPYKNLEALIDAFRRIEANCFLLIAGKFQSSEYKARIDALLAHLPRERFRIEARFVADDEVQKYVLAGDVLVLPYTEILTSGSAMLALSFGVPVIAPNIGSLADVITSQCGLLYDPAEPDGLLRAMNDIRQRRFEAETILAHARTFDWQRSAQLFSNAVQALG